MAIKKSNGEGSIYKDSKGRWCSVLTIGRNEEGKLKRKYFYGKTKKEVSEKLTEYKYKNMNGLIPINESMTVERYFYYWIFEYQINKLKPSTITRYESIFRNYIKSSQISNVKLKDLRTQHLQSYYNSLLEENTPINTLYTLNKAIKACLNQALKEEYLFKNYATLVSLPKKPKNDDIVYFTLEEQKKFIEVCNGHRLESLFLFALGTGLRQGEILSLTWNDINFDDNTVSVSKSIREEKVFNSKGESEYKTLIQQPKTESSNRVVPIPSNIIAKLKQFKIAQNKERLLKGDLYLQDSNFVFTTPVGTPINQSNLRKIYNKLLDKAEIPRIKFHALRHTYATRLFEEGIQVKTVQELMGHSNINTTMNIYTHVTKEVKNNAAEKLNQIFKFK